MKSNYLLLLELEKVFTPQRRGIISQGEIELVKTGLCLESMNDLALQNLRDFVVMFYTIKVTEARESHGDVFALMDKMSAITAVIDNEKVGRGLEA